MSKYRRTLGSDQSHAFATNRVEATVSPRCSSISCDPNHTQTKNISVYARDKQAAEEKAVEIVEGWNKVTSAEAESVEKA